MRKIFIAAAALVLAAGLGVAVYGQGGTAKTINASVNGRIAGINDPGQAASATDQWAGGKASYVYLGNYRKSELNGPIKEPLRWRVLDASTTRYSNTPTMFIMSDKVLDNVKMMQSATDPGYYNESNIRKWLNSRDGWEGNYTAGGFLNTAFDLNEQRALAESWLQGKGDPENGQIAKGDYFDERNRLLKDNSGIQGDKLFFLSPEEADDPDYGFYSVGAASINNLTLKLGPTTYANNRGVYHKPGRASWWLRSAGTGNFDGYSGYVSPVLPNNETLNASMIFLSVMSTAQGVAPATNIDLSDVLFSSPAAETKADTFTQPTESTASEWKLTLKDGCDMSSGTTASAAGLGGSTIYLNPGYAADKVTISHKSLADISADYTCLTAALYGSDGQILYYGKIDGDVSSTKSEVTIPENLPKGDYELKIYGEDRNGDKLTDYASGTPYTLKINVDDPKYTPSLAQPSNCSVSFSKDAAKAGETVKINVKLNEGYRVAAIYVDGKLISGDTFVMPDKNVDVKVVTEKIKYKISVRSSSEKAGKVTGGGTIAYGGKTTLKAMPSKYWYFRYWTKNGVKISTRATLKVSNIKAAADYAAVFRHYPVEFTLTAKGTSAVKVHWKSVKGAAGYQIANDANWQKKMVVQWTGKNSKNTYTSIRKHTGRAYHFKMRYYKVKDGKKIWSRWTPAISIKL